MKTKIHKSLATLLTVCMLLVMLPVGALAASADATLTSTIGAVNNTANTITAIPYATTLANFKAAITPATGATFEVYQSDGTTASTILATGNKVIVTAQDTTTIKTYIVTVIAASADATLTSTIGTVNNTANTITAIPYATTLADFKAAITPATYANFVIFQSDGTTTATILATSNKVVVTAQDTTTIKTYIVTVMAASTDATLTSTIGTVNNAANTITAIPYATTLANFKAGITTATGATFEVYQSDGTTISTILASGNQVIVMSQDASTSKTYTVTVANYKAALTAAITVEIGSIHASPVYVLTEAYYTAATWTNYKAAIAAAIAVENDTAAAQTAIDSAAAAITATRAALVANFTLAISAETSGGAGYKRTVTITDNTAAGISGKYLVVQYTAGTGTSAKVSVVMIELTASTAAAVSYQASGTTVKVWLTSGMPELTVKALGVTVYADATT